MNRPCSALSLLMALLFVSLSWVGLAGAQTLTAPRRLCHNYCCEVLPHVDAVHFDYRPQTVRVELAPETLLEPEAPATEANQYATWYGSYPVETDQAPSAGSQAQPYLNELLAVIAHEVVVAADRQDRRDESSTTGEWIEADYDGYDAYGYGADASSSDVYRDGYYDDYGYSEYDDRHEPCPASPVRQDASRGAATVNRAEHDAVYDREVYGLEPPTERRDSPSHTVDFDRIRAAGQSLVDVIAEYPLSWQCEAQWQVARFKARLRDYWYESGAERLASDAAVTWQQYGADRWAASLATSESPGVAEEPTPVQRQLLRTMARTLGRASDWLENASYELSRLADPSVAERIDTTTR